VGCLKKREENRSLDMGTIKEFYEEPLTGKKLAELAEIKQSSSESNLENLPKHVGQKFGGLLVGGNATSSNIFEILIITKMLRVSKIFG
jgi:hypothetical protein